MKIKSEKEMLAFGKDFTNYLTDRVTPAGDAAYGIAKQTAAEWIAPAGDAAGGSPAPARAGESAAAGPAGNTIIELVGDVGVGKTTFVRGLAKSLGITEPVTSPSFTISKSYALPSGGQLVHYDFYRLSDPGLMADDLADAINTPGNIVVIEWADSISDLLPSDRITLTIAYSDDGSRTIKCDTINL